MINDQLLEYIRHQLSQNVDRDTITYNLKSQGWTDLDINEAFLAIHPVVPKVAPVVMPPLTPVSSTTTTIVSGAPATVENLQNTASVQPTQTVTRVTQTTTSTTYKRPSKAKEIFFTLLIFLVLCLIIGGIYSLSKGGLINVKSSLESPNEIRVTFGEFSEREKGIQAAIAANLSNMRASAELFKDTYGSYLGFCSSSGGQDSKVKVQTVGGTNFVCYDTNLAWSAAARLSASSDYFCVDSTASSNTTKTLPNGTACPAQ